MSFRLWLKQHDCGFVGLRGPRGEAAPSKAAPQGTAKRRREIAPAIVAELNHVVGEIEFKSGRVNQGPHDFLRGEFDILIGINLLREGLDLPEVSLVAILDADKEGFLRSSGSLIQTIGRCARHLNGRAILYADRMTDSMKRAMDETLRRRAIQTAYNEEHGITPESIVRPLDMTLAAIVAADYADLTGGEAEGIPEFRSQEEVNTYIGKLESDMREAAKKFEFEKAAKLRDTIKDLRTKEFLFA